MNPISIHFSILLMTLMTLDTNDVISIKFQQYLLFILLYINYLIKNITTNTGVTKVSLECHYRVRF